MDSNTTFLKRTDKGFKKVEDIEHATDVRVPVEEYVSLEEWNALVEENRAFSEQIRKMKQPGDQADDPDNVIISRSSYAGFMNMLRIIHDRSLLVIDRAKADSNGYTFKYADQRPYDRVYPELQAFAISKSTPISLKVDFETAYFLITKQLSEYYSLIDLSSVVTESYPNPSRIKVLDLLRAVKQRDDPSYIYDFYIDNSDDGRKMKEFLDRAPKNFIFEVIKVAGNIGAGVYDVSYYATGPI